MIVIRHSTATLASRQRSFNVRPPAERRGGAERRRGIYERGVNDV